MLRSKNAGTIGLVVLLLGIWASTSWYMKSLVSGYTREKQVKRDVPLEFVPLQSDATGSIKDSAKGEKTGVYKTPPSKTGAFR